MADDDETGGRTVRMYDRPDDADKPARNPMMIVLIVAAILVLALLLARFVFHVHLRHLLHPGMVAPLNFTVAHAPFTALVWAAV